MESEFEAKVAQEFERAVAEVARTIAAPGLGLPARA